MNWGADYNFTNTNPIYTYGGGGDFGASDLRPISVVLKVPGGFMLQNDPTVLVDWEITRQDTGQAILQQTVPVAAAPARTWSPSITARLRCRR